jgi:hypothetical protein
VRYPACDVRAADLQQEPTKHFEKQSWFSDTVVSSDATKTAASSEHRSERGEPFETASEAIKCVLGASGVEMG